MERAARKPYRPEDDQLILENWWDRSTRKKIAKKLGRSESAVNQRLYHLLKQKGIDPDDYREKMRQRGLSQTEEIQEASETTTKQIADQIIKLIKEENATVGEISKRLNISESDILAKLIDMTNQRKVATEESAAQLPSMENQDSTLEQKISKEVAKQIEHSLQPILEEIKNLHARMDNILTEFARRMVDAV